MQRTHTEPTQISHYFQKVETSRKPIVAALVLSIGANVLFLSHKPAISQGTDLTPRVVALEAKLAFLTTTGTNMTISGANLIINNGVGTTGTANGLGNLQLGYNELRNDTPNSDTRTGSHNLVLGSQNSYSSWGGIVTGSVNTISGVYACVEGGFNNTASGAFSNIGGGYQNVASANSTYIGGGGQNTASGPGASIAGGNSNTASGGSSAISGGYANTTSGPSSYVGGGENNLAAGSASAIAGGYGNTARGSSSAISGGASNSTSGVSSVVLGGLGNVAQGQCALTPVDSCFTALASIQNSTATSITSLQTSVTANGAAITTLQTSGTANATAITALQTSDATNIASIAALQTANSTINSTLAALQASEAADAAAISALQTSLQSVLASIAGLNSVTQYFSVGTDIDGNPALFVTACNMWIQDGSGSSNDGGGNLTGLGNLIIGYNETGNPNGDFRAGSHNLILGTANSYATWGGAVFGYENAITGVNAVVSGGFGNIVDGDYSSITGGSLNTVGSHAGAILGGTGGTVTTDYGHIP